LFLVVLQSTIYYVIPSLDHFVDLITVFVLYAGLFLPIYESIVLAFVVGMLMDCITGGLFGLYISIFIWITVGLRPFISFLNLNNANTLRMLLVIAIVLENAFVYIGTLALKQEILFSSGFLHKVFFQLFWSIILGPAIILYMNNCVFRIKGHVQPEHQAL
jgi:cell shape-determining protein MreD